MDQTGIIYPTLELDGKTYTVKFTRGGLLYRLSKTGTSLADLGTEKSFSALIDILHAALYGQYSGDAETLADLVMSDGKLPQVSEAIQEAVKKVFPPTQTVAAGTVGAVAPQVN